MLILNAVNITGDRKLSREDGTADYDVWVGISHHCIWRGKVNNFQRNKLAANLLRKIADEMDKNLGEER